MSERIQYNFSMNALDINYLDAKLKDVAENIAYLLNQRLTDNATPIIVNKLSVKFDANESIESISIDGSIYDCKSNKVEIKMTSK